MKRTQQLGSTAFFVAVTAALPVHAGLTVIEANPQAKPVVPQVQVIEEGTRLREDNARAAAEIARLKTDLAQVQADLAASQTAAKFAAINKDIDGMEARMNELGVFVMKSHFGFNSVRFEPAEATRDVLLAAARRAGRIRITGHADNAGTPAANRQIGLARARATRQYLTENGIPVRKVVIVTRGATLPLSRNDSEEGRAQNRRVDILFRRG